MTAQTILPANSVTGGFDVVNSAMFDGTSAYMHKTPDSGPSSADLFTISVWVKRCAIGSGNRQVIFDAREDAENFDRISINANVLEWKGIRSDSQVFNLTTNRVFRDPSAWYHLHFIWDSADGTADNRMRIYVNGVQETSFGTRANPSQNVDAIIGADGEVNSVGSGARSGDFWDGYMAEFAYLDGQELTPDGNTGEFEEDSGIWKPIKVSGLTFGTNGFYLDFQASGNLGNDANGGTDLTEVGFAATDQATDTCTNNFCTLNSIDNFFAGSTLAEGNCKVTYLAGSGKYAYNTGTITLTSGKWYHEVKIAQSVGSNYNMFGIEEVVCPSAGHEFLESSTGFVLNGNNGKIIVDGTDTTYGNATAVNDIIGVYIDLDNNKIYFSENGTLNNSGTGQSISAVSATTQGLYFVIGGDYSSGTVGIHQFNFGGCAAFTVSSAVSDDNGHGNFEYSPNITGDSVAKKFYAICSKNLAEFG